MVIARSEQPIMEPIADYERRFFGNVVFTNGHDVEGDAIHLYYGASDEVICRGRFFQLKKYSTHFLNKINDCSRIIKKAQRRVCVFSSLAPATRLLMQTDLCFRTAVMECVSCASTHSVAIYQLTVYYGESDYFCIKIIFSIV